MDIYFLIQILVGFVGLIAIAFPFSENYKIINYKYVFYGVLSQILLAIVLLKIPFIINFFELLGSAVEVLQEATIEGANFVFGYPPSEEANPYRSLL